MKNSLTTKLIGIVLGIFIILISVISFFNYKNTVSQVDDVYSGLQQLALSSSFTTINITMNIEAQQHLKMLVDFLGELNQNDIVAQREILSDVAHLIQYPAVYITYENTGKTLTEYYNENGEHHIANTWDDVEDLRTRDWYIQTKKLNAPIVTSTYQSQSGKYAGKTLSTATIPFTKNGQFAGVIAVDIFVDGFQQRFINFERPELPSMEIFIADSAGHIFSRKHPLKNTESTPTPLEKALAEALKSSAKGNIEFNNFNNTKQIAYYRQFDFGWTIVAVANKSDYEDAINKSFIFSLLLAAVLLIVGATILSFILKAYLSPINRIKEGLLSFFAFINHETNNAPKLLKAQSQDEIGEMGRAINENIQKTQQGLDQDQALVTQSLQVIERAKQGYADTLIELKGYNPQLNRLRDSINDLLGLIQSAVGKNLPEIVRVFDSYTQLDFTTEVKDASGRVEVVT
ncbi:PDC sensor domain-containing protein, partial [Helicobacter japonicus]